MLPLRGVSRGHPVNDHLTRETGQLCPALAAFPTDYGTPFWFTGFLADVGHMLICGRTGFGKTIFMLLCATLFRKYPHAWLYGFDKDLSMRIRPLAGRPLHAVRPRRAGGHKRMSVRRPIRWCCSPSHVTWNSSSTGSDARRTTRRLSGASNRSSRDRRGAGGHAQPQGSALWRLHTVQASLPQGKLANEMALWVGDAVHAHYFQRRRQFDEAALGVDGDETDSRNPVIARPFLSRTVTFYRIQEALRERRARGVIRPNLRRNAAGNLESPR